MQRFRLARRTCEEKTWEYLLSAIFGHSSANQLSKFFSVGLDPLCVSPSFPTVHTSILASLSAAPDVNAAAFAGSSNNPRVSSYHRFASGHQNQTRTIGCDDSFFSKREICKRLY